MEVRKYLDIASANFEHLMAGLKKLMDNNATETEFNEFIERVANNEHISNEEYGKILKEYQDYRRI